jgi:hypothetical protein
VSTRLRVPGGGGGGGVLVAETVIAEQVFAAAGPSATFSAIPATFRDLHISGVVRSTAAGTGTDGLNLIVNGDTGAHYDWQRLTGNGGTASATQQPGLSFASVSRFVPQAGAAAGAAAAFTTDIPCYARTQFTKMLLTYDTAIVVGAGAESVVDIFGVHWGSTAAINSLVFSLSSGANFAVGSVITLWGRAGVTNP